MKFEARDSDLGVRIKDFDPKNPQDLEEIERLLLVAAKDWDRSDERMRAFEKDLREHLGI